MVDVHGRAVADLAVAEWLSLVVQSAAGLRALSLSRRGSTSAS